MRWYFIAACAWSWPGCRSKCDVRPSASARARPCSKNAALLAAVADPCSAVSTKSMSAPSSLSPCSKALTVSSVTSPHSERSETNTRRKRKPSLQFWRTPCPCRYMWPSWCGARQWPASCAAWNASYAGRHSTPSSPSPSWASTSPPAATAARHSCRCSEPRLKWPSGSSIAAASSKYSRARAVSFSTPCPFQYMTPSALKAAGIPWTSAQRSNRVSAAAVSSPAPPRPFISI
mmetsp:Transcript_13911/g.58034  ORF Transcript_13911/g.58034 Transcript_13911/m.58034 type:complete len:233 (-) Transcript_13911:447-1145(-)